MDETPIELNNPSSMKQTSVYDSHTPFLALVMFVSLIISIFAVFLFWQNNALRSRIAELTASPTPQATPSPAEDPLAGWKIYDNDKQGISFKYPSTWEVTETKGDVVGGQVINQNVTLSRGPASISMNLNLSGIGGRGIDLNGEKYVLDDISLYKYREDMENGSRRVGITDNLTESLGVFQAKGKTFSISLVYPTSDTNTYEQDFDKILNTFTFTDTTNKCTLDSDCGINVCDCTSDLKTNIPSNKMACARVCSGNPTCVNSMCVLR